MPMLTYASRQARREGLANLGLLHGDALALPFPEGCFDVVNCCGALHLFADLPGVLGHVQRVLKPGGHFTVATYRQQAGSLREHLIRLRKRVSGMAAFRPEELAWQFNQAGLGEVQCHHAQGIWLIMSATKLSNRPQGFPVR